MARKGSQQRNGLGRKTSKFQNVIPRSVDSSSIENKEKTGEYVQNSIYHEQSNKEFTFTSSSSTEQIINPEIAGSFGVCKQETSDIPSREISGNQIHKSEQAGMSCEVADINEYDLLSHAFKSTESNETMLNGNCNLNKKLFGIPSVGRATTKFGSLDAIGDWSFRYASHVLKIASEWIHYQKPRVSLFISYMHNLYEYGIARIKVAYPILWTWILLFGKLVLFLFTVWLDSSLRGLISLLHLGTASLFTVIWCSLFSVIGMVGFLKLLFMMIVAFLLLIFIGIAPAILVLAISTTVFLWLYGSFWTTSLIMLIGGVSFGLRHEKVALFVTMLYSLHCTRTYMGWLGLILGLNLSFISNDVLVLFLKNNANGHRYNIPQEQHPDEKTGAGCRFHSHYSAADKVSHTSCRESADCSHEIPSTSGRETELNSEDEIARLLSCSDHYTVLGFSRFEVVDVSVLKREYRKMAMLVHPDKNMGNEKAAEAFKKLQNAYEVLLDTLKRKNYDDDLRREDLLNYLRKFQTSSKNEGNGIFNSDSTHIEADDRGCYGESRRIFCKKCGTFHNWTPVERSKCQARWCQDCKDFHQAKDGDGWLEQSSSPYLFGLLQKVDTPHAYICAENKVYDATRWFICQGIRVPANTHKPSFHVNICLNSKHNGSSRASSSSQRGSGSVPSPNMGDGMTEEDFFEWLQNAMNSGKFEPDFTHKEGPSGNSNGSRSSNKKKRKGKRQW